jgi:hypothetical protein
LETIIPNERATIEAGATLKSLKDLEFMANLRTGDRGEPIASRRFGVIVYSN